jgi:hypothetical protein
MLPNICYLTYVKRVSCIIKYEIPPLSLSLSLLSLSLSLSLSLTQVTCAECGVDHRPRYKCAGCPNYRLESDSKGVYFFVFFSYRLVLFFNYRVQCAQGNSS